MGVSSKCSSKPSVYEPTNDVLLSDDEDTLSFCDLPIYSTSGSNSFSSLNQYEYQEEANNDFDFFSGELNAFNRSVSQNNDAILFCGKLIGSKDLTDQNLNVTRKKKSLMFSWKKFKTVSFRKSASTKKAIDSSLKDDNIEVSRSAKKLGSLEKISSAKKVSTLMKCPTKSRWYLFMFGQTRFTQAMTMDMDDLKNRQQRRQCSRSPSMNLETIGGGSGRGGRGFWSLLKKSVTSVGKANANDVVKAVGYMSLV